MNIKLLKPKKKQCHSCFEFGHNSRTCPWSPIDNDSHNTCSICHQHGHNKQTCLSRMETSAPPTPAFTKLTVKGNYSLYCDEESLPDLAEDYYCWGDVVMVT